MIPSAPDARHLPPAVERALAELSTVEGGVESALNLLSGAQIGGYARHSGYRRAYGAAVFSDAPTDSSGEQPIDRPSGEGKIRAEAASQW